MNRRLSLTLQRYRGLRERHENIYRNILLSRDLASKGRLSKEDLADEALLYRETTAIVDDIRKECAAHQAFLEKLACAQWVSEHVNDVTAEPIRGELVVATPDVRQMASLPKKSTHPAAYAAFMDYLGVHGDLQDMVRPHWPSVTMLISDLAARGQPLPPGVDSNRTYPVYQLRMTKQRDLMETKRSKKTARKEAAGTPF